MEKRGGFLSKEPAILKVCYLAGIFMLLLHIAENAFADAPSGYSGILGYFTLTLFFSRMYLHVKKKEKGNGAQ